MGDFEQRKSADTWAKPADTQNTAPLPKPPDPRKRARAEVIRTCLLNVQHWFDRGIAQVGKGQLGGWQDIHGMAHRHAVQAADTLGASADDVDRSTVMAQLEETTRSMNEYARAASAYFINKAKVDPTSPVDPQFDETLMRVVFMIDRQRGQFGMSSGTDVKSAPRARASRSDDTYEAMAIGPTLQLLRLEAEAALAEVRKRPTDATVVSQAIAVVSKHARHAAFLFQEHRGGDEAKVFGASVQAASVAVVNLWRWISGRQNNKASLDAFEAITVELDKVRAAVQLDPLDAVSPNDVSKGQIAVETAEAADLRAAESNLIAALGTAENAIANGADTFFTLAQLKDPPPPDPQWKAIAKNFLIPVIGNLVGIGFGAVVVRLATAVGKQVGGTVGGGVVGTVTDASQAWMGAVVDEATKQAESSNQLVRDALAFKTALVLAGAKAQEKARNLLTERIQHKSVSAREIYFITTQLQRVLLKLQANTAYEAARGFALMMAQRALGTDRSGVTKIQEGEAHFGKPKPNLEDEASEGLGKVVGVEVPRKRVGGKADTTGIAKVVVEVDEAGGHKLRKLQIAGMNQDMAILIARAASGHLDRLGVPTEVELVVPWAMRVQQGVNGHGAVVKESPRLVVDEKGAFRTAIAWQLIEERATGNQALASAFGTPQKAWNTVRHDVLPFEQWLVKDKDK